MGPDQGASCVQIGVIGRTNPAAVAFGHVRELTRHYQKVFP